MYKITFYNNEIEQVEELIFETLKEALKEFKKISQMPWWDADISNLTLTKED